MQKKYFILQLTEKTVNIDIKYITVIDNVEYVVKTEGKAYANSVYGRKQVQEELPENIANAIFAVWGDTENVEDPPKPIIYDSE